jgi:hypothetical protein
MFEGSTSTVEGGMGLSENKNTKQIQKGEERKGNHTKPTREFVQLE